MKSRYSTEVAVGTTVQYKWGHVNVPIKDKVFTLPGLFSTDFDQKAGMAQRACHTGKGIPLPVKEFHYHVHTYSI